MKWETSKDIIKAIQTLKHAPFELLETLGYHFIDSHFYSPVPNLAELKQLPLDWWTKSSELHGMEWQEDRQLEWLHRFAQYQAEYNDFPHQPTDVPHQFHFVNDKFDGTDALVLYCMVRHLKPQRIIEVGGGYSTYVSTGALRKNGLGELTTVEPFPNEVLKRGFPGLSRLLQQKVQDVLPEMFLELRGGDILFIDSTHTVKTGSDVNYLILEILPRLQQGVYIHFHDIFLPQEYPRTWVLEHRLFWSEMYLLRAFLMFNHVFQIVFANNFMGLKHQDKLREAFPKSPWHGGASIWIQKVG